MKTKQQNLYFYKFKSLFKEFFKNYNKIILILAFVGLFAIITGVLTASKYSSKLELGHISNETFVKFLKNDTGVWPLFFKYLLDFLIISAIAIFINIKPFCIIFNIVSLCVYCYLYAFDITIVIMLYGLSGILCSIFILIPFLIAILFIYLIISAIAIKNNLIRNKFGKSCNFNCNYSPLKLYAFLICIAIILLIIQCNIMPIIRVTIIVS